MRALRVHEKWMKRAFELARKGEGLTHPNPPVGAVLVARNQVIGEGYHRKAGGPHAEIVALREAGKASRGATLYVTLEPCSTQGRTGPCTEAIIDARIRKVVVSVRDPNPAHKGKGLAILRRHGIEVVEQVRSQEGMRLLAPFTSWMTTGKPFVRLKLAMSLDGRIADSKGDSKWITQKEARKVVHDMRRTSDAILVGYGTARKDDPELLSRPAYGRHPLRIILDESGRLPLQSRCLNDKYVNQTLIATTDKCSKKRIETLNEMGVEVVVVPAVRGRVDLASLMDHLGERGLLSVFCEGGGELAEGLVKAELVDEFLFFYAPILIGGVGAKASIAGTGWCIQQVPELKITSIDSIGTDILIKAKPNIKRNTAKGVGHV